MKVKIYCGSTYINLNNVYNRFYIFEINDLSNVNNKIRTEKLKISNNERSDNKRITNELKGN